MPRIKNREKKEMEYEQAPSGFVTLYNYKEPFMEFKGGFGYEGVLLFDGTEDTIQCHLCGKWFKSLPHHLKAEHNMNAASYKEHVGLRQTTALISETLRAKLIASGLDKRLINLRHQGGRVRSELTKQKIRKTLAKDIRESQNEHGTCPEQLIERLLKKANELGRTPTSREAPSYDIICKVYGSYTKACEIAGLPYNPKDNIMDALKRGKLTIMNRSLKKIRDFVLPFIEEHKRIPKKADFKDMKLYKSFLKSKSKHGLKKIIHVDGVYRKVDKHIVYTPDELIDFLRNFEKINNRKPSYSDAKRGLIPVLSNYSRYFGSWKNALALIK